MGKNSFLFLLIILIISSLTGCASIVSKSEYPVNITSVPTEADISIANGENKTIFMGKTPAIVSLKAGAGYFKGENYTVTFAKEGYMPHTAQISRGVDGWYIGGNIIVGGLIGWIIVDPITGAMWTLKDLHIDLIPLSSPVSNGGLRVITVDKVPKNLHSEMVRIN